MLASSSPHQAFLLAEHCEVVERELQLCGWSHPWHMCMWGGEGWEEKGRRRIRRGEEKGKVREGGEEGRKREGGE